MITNRTMRRSRRDVMLSGAAIVAAAGLSPFTPAKASESRYLSVSGSADSCPHSVQSSLPKAEAILKRKAWT